VVWSAGGTVVGGGQREVSGGQLRDLATDAADGTQKKGWKISLCYVF